MPTLTARRLTPLLSAMALACLTACGGGGAGPDVTDAHANVQPAAVTFSGVAATGAPMAGAALSVFDRSGSSVCSTTVQDDGRYSCTLASTAAAPFVVTAVLGEQQLVSAFAEARSTTLNVTPITNLIAARLSSNGDPAQLVRDVAADAGRVTADKLQSGVDEVATALRPLLQAAADAVNPLTGNFSADGQGHDRVLDSLQISIRPTGAAANVDITVKTLPSAADAAPLQLSFSTADARVPAIDTAIRPADLVSAGTSALVADLASRLNACYALPLNERVRNAGTGQASLQAPACTTLFAGNDPAAYLHDGARVGPNGAFSGLLGASGTGLRFDRGTFESMQANGNLVISFRWTNPAGNTDFAVVEARREGDAPGVALKLVGNQHVYGGTVQARAGHREFINSPAFSYRSTGYHFTVANRRDAGGNAVFSRVEVTSPAGRVFVLKPTAGLSYLPLQRADGSLARTNGITLAAGFVDPSTPGNPADKDRDPLWAATQLTDAELAALPDHGVWRFEFFHANGDPSVVQHTRTLGRAPTMAEVRQLPIATVTAPAQAALKAAGEPNWGAVFFKTAPTAEAPNWVRLSAPDNEPFWTLPAGAVAPYLVSAFGFGPLPNGGGARTFFNDNLTVGSSARQALITCSVQSPGDNHCDPTLGTSFAADSYLTSIELLARTPRLAIANLTALWTLR